MKKKKKELLPRITKKQDRPIYKTVKTRLKSVLRRQEDLEPINMLVSKINTLTIHSYAFMRLYLLKCYHTDGILPLIDETFVSYLVKTLGIRDKRGRVARNNEMVEKLETFYQNEYQPLVNHTKICLKNTTFILPYLVTQIVTAITNNIQERFVQHFYRFINQTTGEITSDKKELAKFKRQLMRLEPINPKFGEWYGERMSKIVPLLSEPSVNYALKARPSDFLKGMLYMSEQLEQREKRLFQVIPLRTAVGPKNITIDTASLVSLFPNGARKGQQLQQIRNQKNDIWSGFLRTGLKIFRQKGYVFNGQIQTDGVSISLSFIRQDRAGRRYGSGGQRNTEKEPEFTRLEDLTSDQINQLKERKLVGGDPGKRYQIYLVDDTHKSLRYSAPQRRRESHAKRSLRTLRYAKRQQGIDTLEKDLSEFNGKSIDYDKFKNYLQMKIRFNEQTTAFYGMEVWRKERFRQWCYGRRSIDRFLDQIGDTYGEDAVIAYGNWSRKSGMQGCLPSLGVGLRRHIHRRFETITVNEAYTSQRCCGCHSDLEYALDRNGKEIYRLLRCSKCVSSENQNIVFRTRDANSASNILNLAWEYLVRGTRPERFCHPPDEEEIPKKVRICLKARIEPMKIRLSLVRKQNIGTGESEAIRNDFTGIQFPTFSCDDVRL